MLAFMPDSPVEAKFLGGRDKLILIERLRMNQMGVVAREWRSDHLREALTDPKTWLWFALLFSISIPSGGISTFGPLIITTFVTDKFQTILFNIPFGAVQLVSTVGGAFLAQKTKRKGPIVALLCVPPIAGCVVLLVLPHEASHKAALLAAYCLISVYPGISQASDPHFLFFFPRDASLTSPAPLIYAWAGQNTAGDTKRKCVNAALFGNVLGPQLYSQADAPAYACGLRASLALFVALAALCALATLRLRRLNGRHARRRRRHQSGPRRRAPWPLPTSQTCRTRNSSSYTDPAASRSWRPGRSVPASARTRMLRLALSR